jgi:hypothetical protein
VSLIDIGDAPAEFRLAAVAAAALPRELRRELAAETRATIVPWAAGQYARAPGATSTGNRLPAVVTRRPSVTSRAGVVTGLRFGGARRVGSSGATVDTLLRPTEFGSSGQAFTTYTRRGRSVTRRTTTAFAPRRSKGRVIWPTTFDVVAPGVLSRWTRAVFRMTEAQR